MAAEEVSRNAELEHSVAELEQRLGRQLAATVRATRILMVVGVVLAAAIAIYLHVTLGRLQEMIGDPDTMAVAMRQQAERQIGPVMQDLERTLRQNAPKIVANVREEVLRKLPQVREKAEKQLVDYLVTHLSATIDSRLDEVVHDVFEKNKDALTPLIDKAVDPEGKAKLAAEFERLFDEALGKSLDAELAKTDESLKLIRDRLRYLRTAPRLSALEQEEKEILTGWVLLISKAMQEAAEKPLAPLKETAGH